MAMKSNEDMGGVWLSTVTVQLWYSRSQRCVASYISASVVKWASSVQRSSAPGWRISKLFSRCMYVFVAFYRFDSLKL